MAIMVAYGFITFNPPPPPANFPKGLGVTNMGFESIITIGLSLTASAVFSDSLWYFI